MKILPSIQMMLALSSPLVAGLNGAERNVIPLVENDTACGPALIDRISLAAKAAGFTTQNSRARTRMESEPGLDFTLSALDISSPKPGTGKRLVLPIYAVLHAGQHITLSFFVVSSRIEKGHEATIHLAVSQRGHGVVAETITQVAKPGWVPARVTWQTESDIPKGDLTFEILVDSAAPITIAFPRAFVTGR